MNELKTVDQVIAEHCAADPEFAAEWERTAFPRAIANRVVQYRAAYGFTQEDLARMTGLTRPMIGRIELGEHFSALSTLAKLSVAPGLRFDLRVEDGKTVLAELLT